MVESDLKFNKIKNKIFLPEFYQKKLLFRRFVLHGKTSNEYKKYQQ